MKINTFRKAELENTQDATNLAEALVLINSIKLKYNNMVNSYNQLLIEFKNKE